MRRLRSISKPSLHSVGKHTPDTQIPDPREILDGVAMAVSVDETEAARTGPIGALNRTEKGGPEVPERPDVLYAKTLYQVLGVGRLGAVRPLGPRPATQVVVDELVVKKDKQALQEPVQAGGRRDFRDVDAIEPKTEFPVRVEMTVHRGSPAARAVDDPRRSRRVVAVEDESNLDRLEAAGPDVDIDLPLGDRARAVHEDDVPDARKDLGQDRPVLLEAQTTLLTQRRA